MCVFYHLLPSDLAKHHVKYQILSVHTYNFEQGIISRLQINKHSKDLKFVQVTQNFRGSLFINENNRTLFDFKCIFHKTFY